MYFFFYTLVITITLVEWIVLICIPLDTEWKSELINSRNFDKEIGHQNPR